MPPTLRLLPPAVADGPDNMAADDALLFSAADSGAASFRFYAWSAATLSLGYFQPAAPARAYPGLAALPWLRRPSGGAALVHHHELTYALALPPGRDWQPPSGQSWIERFHAVIAEALAGLGVQATICREERRLGDVLCFLHHTPGDLLIGDAKVVGSAQRKHRGAVLQHGGILLSRSEHTPQLPGVRDLTAGARFTEEALRDAVLEALRRQTGWHVEPAEWSAADLARAEEQVRARYASAKWNERR